MNRIVVITGGAGFCGSHIAEHFASCFHIRIFDAFTRNSLRFATKLTNAPNVEIIEGNVLDQQRLRSAVSDAMVVIHCAAIAGVSNYYKQPVNTLRVNILGTFNLLEAIVDAKVPRLIYFSTSEIYGAYADGVAESSPPMSGPVTDRRWVYSASKLAGEHAILRYGETFGINSTIVRPFNIYGPRQIGEGAISNFARRLVCGKPLEVYGDGSEVRAWCHVQDLVAAVDLMLDNEATYGKVFNIGNPTASLTTIELARAMVTIYGTGKITNVARAHTPIMRRTPDIGLARSAFGFEPKVAIADGLKDTIEWFKREYPIGSS